MVPASISFVIIKDISSKVKESIVRNFANDTRVRFINIQRLGNGLVKRWKRSVIKKNGRDRGRETLEEKKAWVEERKGVWKKT